MKYDFRRQPDITEKIVIDVCITVIKNNITYFSIFEELKNSLSSKENGSELFNYYLVTPIRELVVQKNKVRESQNYLSNSLRYFNNTENLKAFVFSVVSVFVFFEDTLTAVHNIINEEIDKYDFHKHNKS